MDPDGEGSASEVLKQAVLADVTFASQPPCSPDEWLLMMSNGNFCLCVPLPKASHDGQLVWRISTGVPTGEAPHAPSTEYLQDLVDAYGPGSIPLSASSRGEPLRIDTTLWSTRYRTHSAIADTPFARLSGVGAPILLIGDAVSVLPLRP